MKWPRVVASLLSVTTVSRCGAILHHDGLYGISTGFQHSDGLGGVFDVAASRERGSIGVGSARAGEGRAEALRRFAASRPMKTGTTIAGVVFEARKLYIRMLAPLPQLPCLALSCIASTETHIGTDCRTCTCGYRSSSSSTTDSMIRYSCVNTYLIV